MLALHVVLHQVSYKEDSSEEDEEEDFVVDSEEDDSPKASRRKGGGSRAAKPKPKPALKPKSKVWGLGVEHRVQGPCQGGGHS